MPLTLRPAYQVPPGGGASSRVASLGVPVMNVAASAPTARTERAQARPASGLRLVRIRLTLALIAAAVVPVALGAPLMVWMGQGLQARVGPAVTQAAAGRLSADLDGLRERLVSAGAAGPLARALNGNRTARTAAIPVLDAIARPEAGVISGVWLLDGQGRQLAASQIPAISGSPQPLPIGDARAAATGAIALPAGADAYVTVVERGIGAVLYVATPVAQTGGTVTRPGPVGVVLARVDLPALLSAVQTGLGGSVVAYSGGRGLPRMAFEPEMNALSTAPGDRVPIDVAGFEGWSVAVRPPPVQLDVSLPLLLLALALGSAAIGLVAWLARQVLSPARELEETSHRLGQLYETARSDALEDSLTGLGNHRAFMEEFDRKLEEGRRYDTPLSLLLIDLDDFKVVNDSAGHAVGDQLLLEVGRLLRATLRRSDRAFRIGGDEFAILMPHTTSEGALLLGRRLLAACSEPRPSSAFPRPFAFSGGISASPEFSTSRSELFGQADAALYFSKRHGRTTVTIIDPARFHSEIDSSARNELSARVARVVAVGGIRPVYEPVVNLANGAVIGFEGLVRPAADSGFADAGMLFSAAEATGRMFDLDWACVEAVIRGARQVAPDQSLSINMSPRTLEAPEFNTGRLVALLAHHDIEAERVTLELTERESVEDVERLRAAIVACQMAGLRIAADDVGAGNAGLRLLSQIHFDIVKIDLSLVQDGAQRDSSHAVLQALTELAQRWGASVIAEGIETPAQLRLVRDLGIQAAQGYLLGRPADAPAPQPVDLDALLGSDDASAWDGILRGVPLGVG